ncbi:crotonobetainyl-CoA:carnitine CoA-transferase CaiB-like acyl-CoA transferase [Knoellia remsis]|uniref:Crotonobetainyl-CoA:carnitine CoA-transferase CaiB-like acyl-CoA transferase n=1 Tax=Knoellia remsis TaxID=407159 RepID=A0A2T0TX48_9MICO|nr:CoA transferase [Knoellia remsis]PRY50274.1 crotonobetainyl-CoA:carnitine CoA-transferase CaiB-like acyl-CoA transferase [Knoellia remsis]
MSESTGSTPGERGPLDGVRVVSVAINLPGPAAVARLAGQGASVVTVLPPSGDPLGHVAPDYFDELHAGQEVRTLDLKSPDGRAELEQLLAEADVLVTSSRPSALIRLGLDHASVSGRHTRLCQVDIVGHPGEEAEIAGHDLTYQAVEGLVRDGQLPSTTAVDLAGAERAAAEAAAALVARERTGRGVRREVALSDVAATLARPVVHGMTRPGGPLGGAVPVYAVYAASEGHVALAALEPHFAVNLATALGIGPEELTHDRLAAAFAERPATEWQEWARERDIPLAAVAEV